MMALAEETEEQKAARLATLHAREALRQAPELVREIRARLTPNSGRVERGVEVALESTPLHTEKADDADEIYVRLLEWVGYWSETLEVVPPSVAIVGWSRVDEDSRAAAPERQFLGFRAGTSPEGAAMLTRLLTLWLLSRDDRIEQDSSTAAFQEDVAQLVWSMRAKYRLTPARDRKVLPRFCGTCKEYAVEAWWASADPLDVVVQCTHCLQPYQAGKPSDILRWITAGDEFRAGCTVCEWVTPGGFTTRDEALDALAQHTRGEHAQCADQKGTEQ